MVCLKVQQAVLLPSVCLQGSHIWSKRHANVIPAAQEIICFGSAGGFPCHVIGSQCVKANQGQLALDHLSDTTTGLAVVQGYNVFHISEWRNV